MSSSASRTKQGDNIGVIYIMTNPSFPEYVKIGYASDINRRLKELNRSDSIPFVFRVYATYAVDSNLSDKKVHSIIDKLNPDLRSVETTSGKKRVREFYAMTAEDAYGIFEAMAEIHNCTHKLKLIPPSEEEARDAKIAEEIDKESKERLSNFSFLKCKIPAGEVVEYGFLEGVKALVVDDRHVEYEGEIMSLSALAKLLSGKKYSVQGPLYFKYRGEWLNDIRARLGV